MATPALPMSTSGTVRWASRASALKLTEPALFPPIKMESGRPFGPSIVGFEGRPVEHADLTRADPSETVGRERPRFVRRSG
jgi:hypothetical protein